MSGTAPQSIDDRINRLEKRLRQMQMLHWFMLCGMILIVSLLGISQSRLGMAVGKVIEGQIQLSQGFMGGDRSVTPASGAASTSGPPAKAAEERISDLEKRLGQMQTWYGVGFAVLMIVLAVLMIVISLLFISLSRLGRAVSKMIEAQCMVAGEVYSARAASADK